MATSPTPRLPQMKAAPNALGLYLVAPPTMHDDGGWSHDADSHDHSHAHDSAHGAHHGDHGSWWGGWGHGHDHHDHHHGHHHGDGHDHCAYGHRSQRNGHCDHYNGDYYFPVPARTGPSAPPPSAPPRRTPYHKKKKRRAHPSHRVAAYGATAPHDDMGGECSCASCRPSDACGEWSEWRGPLGAMLAVVFALWFVLFVLLGGIAQGHSRQYPPPAPPAYSTTVRL
ncbi:uncharacterized protein LOC62_07G009713 [Vanrija pseudolonga]|uniref:Uncharacterized protein n=1 Tax=Vanrija pseudolonga TaxID=143232 RepID=A0AAF0YMG8_9TREE|nr:hypothetical protein LOC62_07G009713 [Vanrija pseudolonga]